MKKLCRNLPYSYLLAGCLLAAGAGLVGFILYSTSHVKTQVATVVAATSPEELLQKLQAGTLRGTELNTQQAHAVFGVMRKNRIRLHKAPGGITILHDLAKVLRQSAAGIKGEQACAQQLGTQLVEPALRKKIDQYLKELGCPYPQEVVVRYLHKDNPSAGQTLQYGIWIRPETDELMLYQTCAHELGHWYYQHALLNAPTDEIELEADEIAFKLLTPQERMALVARSFCSTDMLSTLSVQEKQRFAQFVPEGDFICPSPEHAQNFIQLSRQHQNLLTA